MSDPERIYLQHNAAGWRLTSWTPDRENADDTEYVRVRQDFRAPVNWLVLQELEKKNAELEAEVERLGRSLAFFRSVIKCGESWSAECEAAMPRDEGQ